MKAELEIIRAGKIKVWKQNGRKNRAEKVISISSTDWLFPIKHLKMWIGIYQAHIQDFPMAAVFAERYTPEIISIVFIGL